MADNKEHSTQEVVQMFSTLLDAVKSGNLQNTVLGTPPDSGSYDALAANANGQLNYFVSNFQNEILKAQRVKRMAAVPAAIGLGTGGAHLMTQLMNMNPALGNVLIGHYGADQAVTSLLRNANGLASATGRGLGSVMNPNQLQRNMRWAATQGAMAINNSFNDDGTINTDFTYGLSLPQTASVSNMIMSNKSQYAAWAKKQMERTALFREQNPGISDEKLVNSKDEAGNAYLTENEIKAFSHGTALTANTVISFNEHVKDFQKEMNAFVSSVSKITGSFDSAINFIQNLTNGEAFSAGEKAEQTRRKAMTTAANLRVMAADAGMQPGEMFNVIQNMGSTYDTALGKNYYEQNFSDTSRRENIASHSAAAYAKWAAAHPEATDKDREKFQAALTARTEGFAKGDAHKHNTLLALLVQQGKISQEEAERLAASGRQDLVADLLRKHFGENYESIMDNESFMNVLTVNNRDSIARLDSFSFAEGTADEGFRMNQIAALNDSLSLFTESAAAKGQTEDEQIAIRNKIDSIERNAILDTDMLKKSGLTDAQIKDLQSSDDDNYTLLDKIRRIDNLDERKFNKLLGENIGAGLKEEFGNTADVQTFIDLNKQANPEISEDAVKAEFIKRRREKLNGDNVKLKNDFAAAKNEGRTQAASSILNQIDKRLRNIAASGTDAIEDDTAIGYMVENLLVGAEDKSENGEGLDAVRAAAVGQYKAALDAGLSQDEAWQKVAGKITEVAKKEGVTLSDSNKSLVDAMQDKEDPAKLREFVQESFNQYMDNAGVIGLFDEAAEEASKTASDLKIKDFDKEKAKIEMQREFRKNNTKENRARVARSIKAKAEKKGKKLTDSELQEEVTLKIAHKAAGTGANQTAGTTVLDAEARDFIFTGEKADKAREQALLAAYDKIGFRVDPKEWEQASDEEKQDILYDLQNAAENQGLFVSPESQAANSANSEAIEGTKQLENKNVKDITAAADAQDAANKSGTIKTPTALDKARAKLVLGVKDKVEHLERMFSGGKDDVMKVANKLTDEEKGLLLKTKDFSGELTKKHVQTFVGNVLAENANLSDEEFNEMFKEKYAGLVDAFEFGKDSGISIRQALSAYHSAANVEGDDKDKRKEALADGYITQSYASGDIKLPQDAKDYLDNILEVLTLIADKSS